MEFAKIAHRWKLNTSKHIAGKKRHSANVFLGTIHHCVAGTTSRRRGDGSGIFQLPLEGWYLQHWEDAEKQVNCFRLRIGELDHMSLGQKMQISTLAANACAA